MFPALTNDISLIYEKQTTKAVKYLKARVFTVDISLDE